MSAARPLDIIVFGATGFTGQLVTAHLAEQGPIENIKWGIAGRSKERLDGLLKQVKAPSDTTVLTADANNAADMDKVCREATVVIACAGPFFEFGMPIVDACLRNNTHYCDITGESNFVRLMIEKHHDAATKQGLLLVPQSGFDSVPGDMCNFMVNDYAANNGYNVTDVVSFYRTAGMPSRGTFDTMVNGITGKGMVKADRSPCSLNPPDKKNKIKINSPWLYPWYAGKSIGWASIFLMSLTNNKIVRRTNAILGYKSSYDEAAQCKGFFTAIISFAQLLIFVICLMIPPVRKMIQPKPNSGPSASNNVPFYVTCRGKTDKGKFVQVKMNSRINGYPATAVFAVQTALAIAHDIVRDGKGTGLTGCPTAGVLTPMTAVGPLLIPRLARNKITMEGPVVTE